MIKFVQLHNHSHFSLLDALGSPEDLVIRAKTLGYDTIALTDHATISGLWKFYKAAKKHNIKPILGCEFYVVDDAKIKGMKVIDKSKKQGFKTQKQFNHHLVLLAKNYEGFQILCELISYANDNFYYRPRIDWKILSKINTENLIALSACKQGFIPTYILKKDKKSLTQHIQLMLQLFGKDFYLELQPHDMDSQKIINPELVKLSLKYSIPLILTQDVHYLGEKDYWVRDVAHCIGFKEKYHNPERTKFDMKELYMKGADDLYKYTLKIHPNLDKDIVLKAMQNTIDVANKINIEFNLPKTFETVPLINKPQQFKEYKDYLWYLCETGLKKRGKNEDSEYQKRLKEEYDTIVNLKFIEYFLLVWDLIQWTKNQDIMIGSARGSVASSLVAYCLEITDVDPIKHRLLFWRFIAPNREDLPDIDIDFQEDKREDVKDYLIDKYGKNSVANMITHSILKGKAVLRDVSRVFDVPVSEVNKATKYILQRSGAEMRDTFTIEDSFKTFEEFQIFGKKYPLVIQAAMRLEGSIRHHGTHAAALIVSNLNLRKYCGLIRGKEDRKMISFDKHDSKENNLNLLKIDILGLTNLRIMKKTIELIKIRHNKDIDVYHLPLDDKKVIEQFNQGNTTGVFQFETFGFKKLLRSIDVESFERLAHVNALARPGALHSNATKKYITSQKKRKINYIHPSMEPILKDTYGEVIFQEQLMQMLYDIGKFNWHEVNQIRITMSKSLGSEVFLDKEDKFIKNAETIGIEPDTAKKMYRGYMHYGSWAFNRAHAISYALISYANMWLKIYYPIEYLMSCLGCDEKNEQFLIQEAINNGIKILPPNINFSKIDYSIEGNNIRQGFNQIKGMGFKSNEQLVNNQPYKNWNDFLNKTKRRIINSARIVSLVQTGCFIDWFPNVEYTFKHLADLLLLKQNVIEDVQKQSPKLMDTNLIVKPIDYQAWRQREQKVLDEMDSFYKPYFALDWDSLQNKNLPLIILSGVISHITPKKYKETVEALRGNLTGVRNLELMYCNMNITNEDNETILIQLAPHIFNKYRLWVLEEGLNKPIIAIGSMIKGKLKLYTSRIYCLDDDLSNTVLYNYPLKKYDDIIQEYDLKPLSYRNKLVPGESFSTAIVLEDYKFWATKKGKDMTFIKLSDGNEVLGNIIFWDKATNKYRDYFEIGECYAMFLTKRDDGGLVLSERRGGKIKKLNELNINNK